MLLCQALQQKRLQLQRNSLRAEMADREPEEEEPHGGDEPLLLGQSTALLGRVVGWHQRGRRALLLMVVVAGTDEPPQLMVVGRGELRKVRWCQSKA